MFLHRSAQQRSSQTNKSQSSAGNQVSVCHVLCATHKQRRTRSREHCTPTQRRDGCCRENKKREMLKLKKSHPRLLFRFSRSFALHTFYVIYTRFSLVIFSDFIMIILYFSHACCVIFRGAPVVYSGLFASLVL